MATAAEVQAAYKKVFGRAVDPSGLKTYTTNGMTASQVAADLANSAEYKALKAKKAVAPKVATPVTKDYTKEINALYDPLLSASDASLKANKTALNDEFSGLATRLKDTAKQSEAGLTESMNRYGLLESGRTAAGIGKIQENLSTDIAKADIQRAIQEANMVLENAQYKSSIGLQKLSAVQQTDPLGLEATKLKAANELAQRGFDLTKYKDIYTAYSDGILNSWTKPDDTLIDLIKQMSGV